MDKYKLYGRWKNETPGQHSVLMRHLAHLKKRAKFVMMRVTKETVKPVSRSVGKLTHNNPGPVLEYILLQVQLYDNLIVPVVDSLKYLTNLSSDVLGYCIVEILSENKDRIANDAMAISPWLQSLANFCAVVFKKYNLELAGVLQFVANQLKVEKSVDLLLLREVVQKMGGIDSMEDLTPDQLCAMSGGDLLRREAGQYLQERNTKRSSQRLKDSLLEYDLAIPLLLLMAQQRSSIVYNQTESPHLKVVGKLYDQCQDTMVQFGSYLFQNMSIEELSERLPNLSSLLSDHHINPDVAFFLARPLFVHMLNARYDELRRGERKITVEQKKEKYITACNDIMVPVVDSIRQHFNTKVWEDMDPTFYLTFWTLAMSDLEVPQKVYDREMKKLTDQILAITKSVRDELPAKQKKEVDRLTSLKERLLDEEKKQNEHIERVLAHLQQDKDKWFVSRVGRATKSDTVTAFLQLCLFPRCTFTSLDAMYCAKFVNMLHDLKTPNFSTLICYDRMYCDITYTVASCTEQEAHRYSRFLLGTLETVMHWHSSAQIYERECSCFPGFVTKFRVSRLEAIDYVDYENYRHVVHKWHYKITKAVVTCLESGDYIQIRNVILVLRGILPKFPAIANLASVIEKRIEKVKTDERSKRNDLYVLANSYSGLLKVAKARFVQEKDFHVVTPKQRPSTGGAPVSEANGKNGVVANGEADKSGHASKSKEKAGEKRKTDEVDLKEKESKKVKGKAVMDGSANSVVKVVTDGTSVTRDGANDGDESRGTKRRKTDQNAKSGDKHRKKEKSNSVELDKNGTEKEKKRERPVDPAQESSKKKKVLDVKGRDQ